MNYRAAGAARRYRAEPDFELQRYADDHGRQVRFNKEAREQFINFATRPDAAWRGNFRDFGGAITRLCTRAQNGRIAMELVERECERLQNDWQRLDENSPTTSKLIERHLGDDAQNLTFSIDCSLNKSCMSVISRVAAAKQEKHSLPKVARRKRAAMMPID